MPALLTTVHKRITARFRPPQKHVFAGNVFTVPSSTGATALRTDHVSRIPSGTATILKTTSHLLPVAKLAGMAFSLITLRYNGVFILAGSAHVSAKFLKRNSGQDNIF